MCAQQTARGRWPFATPIWEGSLLLTNEDLPGLFSISLYNMFCVSEYSKNGVVTDLDRIAGLESTVTE